jgi:predicted phosphodiesterase
VRLAVIADVHGNAVALDAVLADVERAGADAVVVAGDAVPGPEPAAVLARLRALEGARFVRGNGDREVVEAFDAAVPFDATEPDAALRTARWTAERIGRADRDALAAYEPTVLVRVDGLGDVLVCHATPGSDEAMLTRVTPEPIVARALEGAPGDVVVCGHTHAQYDRAVAGRRLVNAGSVGLPYEGRRGAFWALLGPDGVDLRRTEYDVDAVAERIEASGWPDPDDLVDTIMAPPAAREAEEHFERVAAERGER